MPAQHSFTIWRVNDYDLAIQHNEAVNLACEHIGIERLSQQAGLLKPKIDDWRAMMDCVMIDTAYDGKVFNVVLSDVPEKKTDYVQGSYELSAPGGERTVAVKIIDMLGEEVLVTKNV